MKEQKNMEEAPIREGQVIESLQIESIGGKGDGLGKVQGFVVFVPNTAKGQTYNVRITRVQKTVAFGEVC